MKKKKKKKQKQRRPKTSRQCTISYVCSSCGSKEEIPEDVLEYFDEINPQQLLFGTHEFTCESCGTDTMKPEEEPEVIIRGYGLFEGFEKN